MFFIVAGYSVTLSKELMEILKVASSSILVVYGVLLLIPLIWAIPLTEKVKRISKYGETSTDGFKFCVILLLSPIAGVYLFCAKDDTDPS